MSNASPTGEEVPKESTISREKSQKIRDRSSSKEKISKKSPDKDAVKDKTKSPSTSRTKLKKSVEAVFFEPTGQGIFVNLLFQAEKVFDSCLYYFYLFIVITI